jgi:hypothetical protein
MVCSSRALNTRECFPEAPVDKELSFLGNETVVGAAPTPDFIWQPRPASLLAVTGVLDECK